MWVNGLRKIYIAAVEHKLIAIKNNISSDQSVKLCHDFKIGDAITNRREKKIVKMM